MKAQDVFGTVLTAMVTPFTPDGTRIDFDAAAQLASDLVDAGCERHHRGVTHDG